MVLNYGLARSGAWERVYDEVKGVVTAAHANGVGIKVILETSELTLNEIKKATEICADAGADFVKTSTGFSSHGATPEAVAAMLDAAQGRIKVKASGGIRTKEQTEQYLAMGATRLGVGSSTTPVLCSE
jgi:deoxyribose-phosphate aldolase